MTKRILVALLVLCACNHTEKLPAGVLPPERMTAVMRQVFIADEWVSWRAEKDSSLKVFNESVALYKGIFEKEKITEDQFRKSFRYYQDHPGLLKPVFDSLNKRPGFPVATPVTPPPPVDAGLPPGVSEKPQPHRGAGRPRP